MMLTRSRRSFAALLVACLAAATACDDDETTGPLVPRTIAKVSGDAQPGIANFPVAEPLVVKVTAADEEPVAGVPVAFSTSAPGATLSVDTAFTDEEGLASAAWTLGPTAGEQTATATVANVGSVTFTATAEAPTVLFAAPTSGANQIGLAGQSLLQPVTVTVIGSNNAPLAGVPVNFSVTTGGGTLSATDVVTDANGQATVNWTLGVVNGVQTITALVPGTDPIVISANADPCLFEQPFGDTFTGELGGLDCQLGGKFADLFATGASGTAQLITVTSAAFTPYLTLVGATDTLAFGEAAGNSSSFTLLVGSAPSRLSVSSTDAGATGAYTITNAPVADITGCATVFATTGSETSQQVTDTDCAFPVDGGAFFSDQYTIFLAAGQSVAITEAPEAFDAFITLIGPDGEVVATQDQGGGGDAETLEFTAEVAGFYVIDAGTFDPDEVGPYTLTIE